MIGEPVLRETWLAVIEHLGARNLVTGGKSMGGRIASLVADEANDEANVAGSCAWAAHSTPPGSPRGYAWSTCAT